LRLHFALAVRPRQGTFPLSKRWFLRICVEINMSERSRMTTSCLVGVTAAVLLLVLPVEAQVPMSSPSSPVVTPQETVKLTMEQKHVIKEIIIKDMKTEQPQDQAAKVPTKIGETVPAGIPLQPIPVEVSAKIPQIKSHSFIVKGDKVVIVDTKDNKVAALVE
jgi:membrane-bound ClpP family serine protease